MKCICYFVICLLSTVVSAHNLQLHNDFRHSIDPENNDKNYATFSFETFKQAGYGSLFMKMDLDLKGRNNNIGNLYTEISHTLKFWKFPVFMHLQYCGGLGFINQTTNGYYINNAYLIGAAYPFQWQNAWFSTFLAYRYNNFDRISHDIQFSFYWGKNILSEKISITGHFVIWSENNNHGDAWTDNLDGKKFLFLSEPQIWYNLNKLWAIGSEIKLFYHVYSYSDQLLIYPTVAIKYNF